MTAHRLILVVASVTGALTSLGASCGPPPPTSDTCADAPDGTRATITSLDIGRMVDGVYVPITDGDTVGLVTGGQGLDMVVARLRIRGTGLTGCIAQSTALDRADGEPVSSESAPIAANRLGPDLWLTGEILLPWYSETGVQARISSHVLTADAAATFWVGYAGELDAAPSDAAPSDAAPVDAAPADAPVDAPVDASPDA